MSVSQRTVFIITKTTNRVNNPDRKLPVSLKTSVYGLPSANKSAFEYNLKLSELNSYFTSTNSSAISIIFHALHLYKLSLPLRLATYTSKEKTK